MSNSFDIKDCGCEAATIYSDRAEVRRRVKLSIKQGENEITFTNLSQNIDEESVRVEGQGPATISEVSFQTKYLTPQEQEENESSNKEYQDRIKELQENEKAVLSRINRLQKQRNVLDGFADSVMKPSATNAEKEPATLLNSEVLSGMRDFFGLFDEKATSLDESLQDARNNQIKIRQEIQALEQRTWNSHRNTHERHLSVLLDGQEEAEVTLFVSYLVHNAGWSPKYDIRVFSEEKKMKIVYQGVIRQGTGEDWNDVKVSLSSAMPNVGGTAPKLGTQKIGFVVKIAPAPVMMKMMSPMRAMARSSAMVEEVPAMAYDEMATMAAPMAMPQATVKESISSAVYEIVRPATIPSDNTEHKVTIAIIDLQPQFHYACIPRKSTFAYLKAAATNTSNYAMLAGQTNIFLDNNFIAKGHMNAVSPGEEFDCSCGVDPAIKISYKPVEKHRSNQGFIQKSKVTTFKQVIQLNNTHKETVQVRVLEHLPLSSESSIKVNLLEPKIPRDKPEGAAAPGPVHLNKEHNVEWILDLTAGSSKDLQLIYSIEQPANEELEYSEDFPVEQ